MSAPIGITQAPEGFVFLVKYSHYQDKTMYAFWCDGYEQKPDRYRFINARVPRAVGGPLGSIAYAIQPPELDKVHTYIYAYEVKRPAWFDHTDEDAVEDPQEALAEPTTVGEASSSEAPPLAQAQPTLPPPTAQEKEQALAADEFERLMTSVSLPSLEL